MKAINIITRVTTVNRKTAVDSFILDISLSTFVKGFVVDVVPVFIFVSLYYTNKIKGDKAKTNKAKTNKSITNKVKAKVKI
jgi:hypothetical protein